MKTKTKPVKNSLFVFVNEIKQAGKLQWSMVE